LSRVIKRPKVNIENTGNTVIPVSEVSCAHTDESADIRDENRAWGDAGEWIMDSARQKADQILETARIAARDLENDARVKAQDEMKKAITAGYDEGLRKGRQAGFKQYESLIASAAAFLEQLKDKEDRMIRELEDELYLLALDAARKISLRELDQDDSALFAIFENVMQNVRAGEWLVLTLSSKEYKIAARNRQRLMEIIGGIPDFRIVADWESEEGVIIVETAQAMYDASVDAQLDAIGEIVDEVRRRESTS